MGNQPFSSQNVDLSGSTLPTLQAGNQIVQDTLEGTQRDEALEDILNGGLFLGGEETPQGSYFYASGVTVQGSADLSEEIPQAIRLGQLEGGGTIRFSEVNKSRGIEGYFIPFCNSCGPVIEKFVEKVKESDGNITVEVIQIKVRQ